MIDREDVERVLGYLRNDEAEIRSTKANVVWADTMARATDLIRQLHGAPANGCDDCAGNAVYDDGLPCDSCKGTGCQGNGPGYGGCTDCLGTGRRAPLC
jgi:hypothetical protein